MSAGGQLSGSEPAVSIFSYPPTIVIDQKGNYAYDDEGYRGNLLRLREAISLALRQPALTCSSIFVPLPSAFQWLAFLISLSFMATELTNGFGKVYLTIDYDAANRWVYNNWIGYQTYTGIVVGADACLHPLRENNCSCLLNDNREVVGPWDHAVEWIVTDWAPRAIAQGLTHFANVVSPESMAALSAEAMHLGIGGRLQMRMFGNFSDAQAWLREAHSAASSAAR